MEKKQPSSRRSFLKGVAASPVLLAAPAASLQATPSVPSRNIGPSTTTEPYLLPSITGARTKSILTVGDSVEGYRMVGIPDGLGAFRTGHCEFTLLMNHEITVQVHKANADVELVEGGQLLALFVDPGVGFTSCRSDRDDDDDRRHHR